MMSNTLRICRVGQKVSCCADPPLSENPGSAPAYCYTRRMFRDLYSCVLGTRVSCAKTDEPIEMLFGAHACVPKEPCATWGPDPLRRGAILWSFGWGMIQMSAKVDEIIKVGTRRRCCHFPFTKLLWTLVYIVALFY